MTPLVGMLFGRGDRRRIGAVVRRGLVINTVFTLMVMAVMGTLYFFLDSLGQPAELLPLIRPYYLIMLAGMLPVALFNVFAQWSYAIGDSRTPMWIILGANALNVAANYALIYGNWACPELGLTGAGIATLVSRVACALVMGAIFALGRRCAPYREGYRERTLHAVSRGKV